MTTTRAAVLVIIVFLSAAGCNGVTATMNTDQATAMLDGKAQQAFALLPPDASKPVPYAGPASLGCGDNNEPPDQAGVTVYRDYIVVPMNADLAMRSIENITAALTGRGFVITADSRNKPAPAVTLQDPADSFRTSVQASGPFNRLTIGVSSPCVEPAASH